MYFNNENESSETTATFSLFLLFFYLILMGALLVSPLDFVSGVKAGLKQINVLLVESVAE